MSYFIVEKEGGLLGSHFPTQHVEWQLKKNSELKAVGLKLDRVESGSSVVG